MNYQNLFKIAIRAIAANKMRSFLTALGIIIGIAAVITMLAIGQGSKASIKANIAEMGSNMIMISPGADMRGGVRQDASAMETLKQADYQTIKDECNYISAISPTVNSSGQWINGNNNTQSSIYGVNQDYLSIRQLKVADGEMFTDNDIKAAAKVCILGQTVVDYLSLQRQRHASLALSRHRLSHCLGLALSHPRRQHRLRPLSVLRQSDGGGQS